MRWIVGIVAIFAIHSAGRIVEACFIRSALPVQVWADHVEVLIREQVCIKKYDCKFLNPNSRAVVDGTCYMEVEPGAQVDRMSLLIDGEEVQGELLSRERANQVFTEIVAQGGSPALLEFYGNQLIRTQVPNIPPNGTVTVKLQYTTILKPEHGVYSLRVLNTNPKALVQRLHEASVRIRIESENPIQNVYSPTHPIRIDETADDAIVVEWSEKEYLPKSPFMFYFSKAEQAVGANLLAYREPGDKGYFMLMLSPSMGANVSDAPEISPKDVVFCVDTSGSMAHDRRLRHMQDAVRHCLSQLNDRDRFNIVRFSSEIETWEDGLQAVTTQSVLRAKSWIDTVGALGGTAAAEALETSLAEFGDDERMKMIFFITDGRPNIGESSPEGLLKLLKRKNTQARIFVFGVGSDVNTRLLDAIASENRGDSEYMLASDEINKKLGPYFDRVGAPLLADARVKIEGVEVEQVYPRGRVDVYRGGQVILFGRYEGSGDAEVTVTGKLRGVERSFIHKVVFPETAVKSDFVPRLWAGRKVGFLLSELRRNGENKEVVAEVEDLARRFGIVTPYTSYLVVPEKRIYDSIGGGAGKYGGRLGGNARLGKVVIPGVNEDRSKPFKARSVTDQREVRDSKELSELRSRPGLASRFDDLADEKLHGRSSLEVMRHIGTRTFYNRNGIWRESSHDPKQDTLTKVTIGSDAYIKLIEEGLAKYLALGKVILRHGDRWLRVE